MSLISLTPLLQTMPREVDGLGTGGLDPLTDRLVARRLRVPGLEALDVDVELVRPRPERVGDTLPERLVVVEDVDARLLQLLEQIRGERALVVVGSRDAGVVADLRRVVDVRLTGVVPRRVVRQPHRGVRGGDHRDGAARRAVQDRDLELCATGVERAEHAEHRPVVRVRASVRRALLGRPATLLSGRVVARLVADA